MSLIYKIYNEKTRLFSKGGCPVKWTKTGKIWKNIGHLKNHIRLLEEYDKLDQYDTSCKILQYEILITNTHDIGEIDNLYKTMEIFK